MIEIWRVELYSYEVEKPIILCDVNARSEKTAIKSARVKLRYTPYYHDTLKYKDLIDSAVMSKSNDEDPWFLMARVVDEMKYPIDYGMSQPANHISLDFVVADNFTFADVNRAHGSFESGDAHFAQAVGTAGTASTVTIHTSAG